MADPIAVDPQHYTVEAEDERVRVLRIRYVPRSARPCTRTPPPW